MPKNMNGRHVDECTCTICIAYPKQEHDIKRSRGYILDKERERRQEMREAGHERTNQEMRNRAAMRWTVEAD